ncbi:MAG TPA: FUSC family protein [Flavipsychrobacter sp.]|nr:FUSC family protein [Flavipsychrobacter sp.]
MRYKAPYQSINKLLEDESFEPRLSWGLRMAIAAIVPVIWGLITGNIAAATWMTLTAECICWVELKGSFRQRASILLVGLLLAVCFATLGTITAEYEIISVICIFIVCFLAGLFKNLGDRGSGLAICIYVIFIVCNAYPVKDAAVLRERVSLVLAGGIWTFIVGITGSFFIPLRQPYRRSIALIWKANASLLHTIQQGWDSKSLRKSNREIYLQEKQVRTAIDSSLQLFENRAFQTDIFPAKEVELAKLRKLTALVGIHLVSIGDELDSVKLTEVNPDIKTKLSDVLLAMEQVLNNMALYILSLKPESLLIVEASIDSLNKKVAAFGEALPSAELHKRNLKRVMQLCERSIRLIETGLIHLTQIVGDKPVYSSYSYLKTLYLLQPQRWVKSTQLLFNFNTLTVRYILRSALAASVAIFAYKWFDIDHGYWLAFTVVLVMQPYFGATLKKALERIIGTLTGGVVGGLLAQLNDGFYLKEILLFICLVGMVYYVRKNYSIAAFCITVSLVLLFDAEATLNWNIIMMRALCTIGGACLAVLAGFTLLPDWDSKWLPRHIARAITDNYRYFISSFFSDTKTDWTKWKRLAETANSNAFDSFNRYLSEPVIRKRPVMSLYHIILHNVHITRELNNIHLEDEIGSIEPITLSPEQTLHLHECLYWFNEIIELLKHIDPKVTTQPLEDVHLSKQGYTTHQMFYADKMLYELKTMHGNLKSMLEVLEEKHL